MTTKVVINGMVVEGSFEDIQRILGIKTEVSAQAPVSAQKVQHSMVNTIDTFYDETQKSKPSKPYTYKKSRKNETPTAYPLKTEDFTSFEIIVDRNAVRLLGAEGEDNLRFVAKTAHTVLVEKIKSAGGIGRKVNNMFVWVFPDNATAEKFRNDNQIVEKADMNKLIKEWNKKRGF